jgi:hypothetical protein
MYQVRIRIIVRPTVRLVQPDFQRYTSVPDALAQPAGDVAGSHCRVASRRGGLARGRALVGFSGVWRELGRFWGASL